MSEELTPAERVTAAGALADVHCWAAIAWRGLGAEQPPVTRSFVTGTVDDIIRRLQEVRRTLAGSELPAADGQRTGTAAV